MIKVIRFAIFLLVGIVALQSCQRKIAEVTTDTADTPPQVVETTQEPMSQPKPTEDKVDQPYIMLHFERTACYGTCPVYKADIWSDGSVHYNGKTNVKREGQWNSRLNEKQLAELKAKIKDVNFFSFATTYPKGGKYIYDLPMTITKVTLESGEVHQVNDNHDAPKALIDFENYVDHLLEKLSWKGGPEKGDK